MQLKALTFNIHHGRGTDGKLDLNRIAEVLRESDADLIGLCEVDKLFSRRSGYADQLQYLADQLNMHSAFGASITIKTKDNAFLRQYGNALLSRYPIVSHTTHLFHTKKRLLEGRSLLAAEIRIGERPMRAVVTHLSLNPWKQSKQAAAVLKMREQSELPFIAMGDWNMRRGSKIWRIVANKLTDVCAQALCGPCLTFPSMKPAIQLDYIFVSEHFQATSAQVFHHSPKASDHLPLTAMLQFNDRS